MPPASSIRMPGSLDENHQPRLRAVDRLTDCMVDESGVCDRPPAAGFIMSVSPSGRRGGVRPPRPHGHRAERRGSPRSSIFKRFRASTGSISQILRWQPCGSLPTPASTAAVQGTSFPVHQRETSQEINGVKHWAFSDKNACMNRLMVDIGADDQGWWGS